VEFTGVEKAVYVEQAGILLRHVSLLQSPVITALSQSEQHVNIKFFCTTGKSAVKTPVSLDAIYGKKAIKKSL
jgi:hypothetical protein